jgi:hypothetical protein
MTAERRRAAFGELHGARLHGFALLLTLGDQAVAARLAADALAEGSMRATELSHPERAAAWLRWHVVQRARSRLRDGPGTAERRRATLEDLGADAAAFASFAALDVRERAAVAASIVERFDRRDVATVVGLDGTRLDRLMRQARARAIASAVRVMDDDPPDRGPIMARIRSVTDRALR